MPCTGPGVQYSVPLSPLVFLHSHFTPPRTLQRRCRSLHPPGANLLLSSQICRLEEKKLKNDFIRNICFTLNKERTLSVTCRMKSKYNYSSAPVSLGGPVFFSSSFRSDSAPERQRLFVYAALRVMDALKSCLWGEREHLGDERTARAAASSSAGSGLRWGGGGGGCESSLSVCIDFPGTGSRSSSCPNNG